MGWRWWLARDRSAIRHFCDLDHGPSVIAITAGQALLIHIVDTHAMARESKEEIAMLMITTTHPVAGFESRPLPFVAERKDHWGFWSSFGWVVLAITVATVSLVPLSFAY